DAPIHQFITNYYRIVFNKPDWIERFYSNDAEVITKRLDAVKEDDKDGDQDGRVPEDELFDTSEKGSHILLSLNRTICHAIIINSIDVHRKPDDMIAVRVSGVLNVSPSSSLIPSPSPSQPCGHNRAKGKKGKRKVEEGREFTQKLVLRCFDANTYLVMKEEFVVSERSSRVGTEKGKTPPTPATPQHPIIITSRTHPQHKLLRRHSSQSSLPKTRYLNTGPPPHPPKPPKETKSLSAHNNGHQNSGIDSSDAKKVVRRFIDFVNIGSYLTERPLSSEPAPVSESSFTGASSTTVTSPVTVDSAPTVDSTPTAPNSALTCPTPDFLGSTVQPSIPPMHTPTFIPFLPTPPPSIADYTPQVGFDPHAQYQYPYHHQAQYSTPPSYPYTYHFLPQHQPLQHRLSHQRPPQSNSHQPQRPLLHPYPQQLHQQSLLHPHQPPIHSHHQQQQQQLQPNGNLHQLQQTWMGCDKTDINLNYSCGAYNDGAGGGWV
ncbi:hypothetical protein HK104_002539, partial [Borealophlyctis nickersoniae]